MSKHYYEKFCLFLCTNIFYFHLIICTNRSSAANRRYCLYFQSGGQGKAVQLATKSKYTHVGITFVENGVVYVYHAVEPVMKSTFKDFLKYSADNKYIVKRLKNQALLTPKTNEQMRAMAISLLDKHYDIYFDWKDNEWYCSEFVWKLYNRNYKIEIGALRPLKDFDLSSKEVQAVMKKDMARKFRMKNL